MYNKILIINKSHNFTEYLKEKLSFYDVEVINANDGIDGLLKLRNHNFDLIIMDYNMIQNDNMIFLKEKYQSKSTEDIPIIILYSKKDRISKDMILELTKYRLYKLLPKPIEIDLLFKVISEIFNIKLDIDLNPCFINLNLSNDALLVKISKGFNKDKINLMKFKILEIKEINRIKFSKIMLIMIDIEFQKNLEENLDLILKNILNATGVLISKISLISDVSSIKEYYSNHAKYRFISITDENTENNNKKEAQNIFINNSNENNLIQRRSTKNNEISLNLNYSFDKNIDSFINIAGKNKKINIAVVDDDLNVLELMEVIMSKYNWNIDTYENGGLFLKDLEKKKPDLIFLDLIMPGMNGFEVMDSLKLNNYNIPIIVMSGLVDKRFIFKAKQYGIAYFLSKPVIPKVIIEKVEDVLKNRIFNKFENSFVSNWKM